MDFMQFFKDDSSQLSQMRLTLFMVVASVLGVFLIGNITNVITAIMTKSHFVVCDFAPQMMTALGIVVGGKVVQAFSEKKQ